MDINIQYISPNPDTDTVTIAYTVDGSLDDQNNPALYSTTVPYDGAPNQDDLTSTDNYDYYVSKLLGN